jgi:hypothetical protein
MSKYDDLKYLKPTRARVVHTCNSCNSIINKGDTYYSEKLRDTFLHSLHERKFCMDCYEKFGDGLLKKKN